METLIVKIGWSSKNYSASAVYGDDVIFATADTLDAVKTQIFDALEFHFEGLAEDGKNIPNAWEIKCELQASALLKALDGFVSRAAISRLTLINQKQLGHYIQGRREAKEETRNAIIEGIEKVKEELDRLIA